VTQGLTPSQTVGPYLHIALDWADGPHAVPPGTPGAVWLRGRLLDAAGDPVPDGLIETWQADPDGRFDHPDDPRGPVPRADGFRGFARCPTGPAGEWAVLTLKPGRVPAGDGRPQAPHVDVSVFARGLLDRLVTRIYFPDEPERNAADPVLSSIDDPARRSTLVAADGGDGTLRFDIHLQGEHETAFFAV
jgi:protocatechuate 3,4-dioxygenase, alpha subunit